MMLVNWEHLTTSLMLSAPLGIEVNEAGFNTSLWPLAVTAAPHAKNVIEPGDEEL